MNASFRSCYIVDVKVDNEKVILTDSSRNTYVVDLSISILKDQFKTWLSNVFLHGIPQFLTVFEYETKDISECEVELYIKKFFTTGKKREVLNG